MNTIQEMRAAHATFADSIRAATAAQEAARDAINIAKVQRRDLLTGLMQLAEVTGDLVSTIIKLEAGCTQAEVQYAWKLRERLSPLAESLGYELVESSTSRVNAIVKELS